ncbi:hypothetical protein BJ138DRAFT_1111076 [Hygrophoropsis aurantiaca]|uniref:Uncharacterized protein n=1 Tax=Hygrophoropsis aurantiaca TaxID=72124 RepID=A0ACB8AMP8_9AGAM|nr:hypothetical protein BJ138DRAFT_1111076 [Hygrophoropsis aurantiaca]
MDPPSDIHDHRKHVQMTTSLRRAPATSSKHKSMTILPSIRQSEITMRPMAASYDAYTESFHSLQSSTANANTDFDEPFITSTGIPQYNYPFDDQGSQRSQQRNRGHCDNCCSTSDEICSFRNPSSAPCSAPIDTMGSLSLILSKAKQGHVCVNTVPERKPQSPRKVASTPNLQTPSHPTPVEVSNQVKNAPGDLRHILNELESLAIVVKALPIPGEPVDSNVMSSFPVRPIKRHSTKNDIASKSSTWNQKEKWTAIVHPQTSSEPQFPPGILHAPTSHGSQNSVSYIYDPRGTPEFLIGGSNSLLAFPAHGYASPPGRPEFSAWKNISNSSPRRRTVGHQRIQDPLSAPAGSKASFKAFFQRSRCNTTASGYPAPRTIPLAHTPVESTISRERRIRLAWPKI